MQANDALIQFPPERRVEWRKPDECGLPKGRGSDEKTHPKRRIGGEECREARHLQRVHTVQQGVPPRGSALGPAAPPEKARQRTNVN